MCQDRIKQARIVLTKILVWEERKREPGTAERGSRQGCKSEPEGQREGPMGVS